MRGLVEMKSGPRRLKSYLKARPQPKRRAPGVLLLAAQISRLRSRLLHLEAKIQTKCNHANSDLYCSVELQEPKWISDRGKAVCVSAKGDLYKVTCALCGFVVVSTFVPDKNSPKVTAKLGPMGSQG